MLKSINFKHLFYFWMVGRERSVSKASTLLNVSQSSISEQMKTLEESIGIKLFDRGQNRLSLTETGKVLYQQLNEFFPPMEELFESLINHKSTDVRFIRIGLCPTLSIELRYKLCFPFIQDKHYTVRIVQGENQFLLDAFNKDEIDMMFTTNESMSPHGRHERYLLDRKSFAIVGNKSMQDKLKNSHQYKSLNGAHFINYTSDSDLHFKLHDFMHRQKIHPLRIAEIDDINLVKKILLDFDCFSILPLSAVKQELESKQLFSAPIEEIEGKVLAIYKPTLHEERLLTHFEEIRKKIRSI